LAWGWAAPFSAHCMIWNDMFYLAPASCKYFYTTLAKETNEEVMVSPAWESRSPAGLSQKRGL
jgi:hypothetical protein